MNKWVITALLWIAIFLFFLLLVSCKSKKTEKAAYTLMENTNSVKEANNYKHEEQNSELFRIIEQTLSEKLDFYITVTEYDTEKPVLQQTGNPPVKRKRETSMQKNTSGISEISELHEAHTNINELSAMTEHADIQNQIQDTSFSETNIQKESDIFLKWLGGIFIGTVFAGLLVYIVNKRLKKNRFSA